METQDLLLKITGIVRSALDDDTITISPQTGAKDVDGWDSLTNVRIIADIEKAFSIRFKLADILKFKTIGDICNAIAEKRRGLSG